MPRFFKEDFENAPFISGGDANHIIKSLRMRVGEKLVVCDTKGQDFNCEIAGINGDEVSFKILSKTVTASEPNVKVTLFQCLPKGDKLDSVTKQSVELGVYEIRPVLSERCISRPDKKQASKKTERLQKIAVEAAGQSGRGILPQVFEPITYKQMLDELKNYDIALFFYELGGKPMEQIPLENKKKIAVIIGSEGGFSVEEATAAKELGAVAATLGPRILRTETAPLAALSNIMLITGNMK